MTLKRNKYLPSLGILLDLMQEKVAEHSLKGTTIPGSRVFTLMLEVEPKNPTLPK